ncbi:MAG TPA: hypothetical protein VGB46_05080 [Flavisolibacter sp.]|jgi:hypothetical protein
MIKELIVNQLMALRGQEIVNLKGNRLRVLDIEFPLILDKYGSITEVKNISKKRDILTRITFLIGSLDFIQNDLLSAEKQERGDSARMFGSLRYATVEALVDFLFLLTRVSSEDELETHVVKACARRARLKEQYLAETGQAAGSYGAVAEGV